MYRICLYGNEDETKWNETKLNINNTNNSFLRRFNGTNVWIWICSFTNESRFQHSRFRCYIHVFYIEQEAMTNTRKAQNELGKCNVCVYVYTSELCLQNPAYLYRIL